MIHRYTLSLFAFPIAACALAQPPMDEVACYSFTGDATDGSGNSHDGNVSGATLTTDRFGTANKAYAFDGVLDHIEVPDFNSFGISSEVSVGMWVRALSYTGNFAVSVWPDVFSDRFSAAPYYGHSSGSTIFWDFGDCLNGGRTSIIPYPFVSQWEHFTFTSSAANNRMRIYHNGTLIDEEFHSSALIDINRALELGGGNTAGYSHWNGDLDEIVLYDRELSAQEVADLYTFGAPCQYHVGVLENAAA
ncbi:MAG: LamG domain-containing protein [Flavobacteriales bacterium]